MDFGDFPKLLLPTAYVSAAAIIYREHDLYILKAVRKIEPWKNAISIEFGGYIEPTDQNPACAAVREVREETGLQIEITHLVGIYGPERYHHEFKVNPVGSLARLFRALKTAKPAHDRPVVHFAFAGRVIGDALQESNEVKQLEWVDPEELDGQILAFDSARTLADFLKRFHYQDGKLPLKIIFPD